MPQTAKPIHPWCSLLTFALPHSACVHSAVMSRCGLSEDAIHDLLRVAITGDSDFPLDDDVRDKDYVQPEEESSSDGEIPSNRKSRYVGYDSASIAPRPPIHRPHARGGDEEKRRVRRKLLLPSFLHGWGC